MRAWAARTRAVTEPECAMSPSRAACNAALKGRRRTSMSCSYVSGLRSDEVRPSARNMWARPVRNAAPCTTPIRLVTGGDESRFLRQLATRARQRILAVIECPGRHLPRRLVPRVAPLTHEHRVGIVEVGDDERRVGVGDHDVRGFGTVRKPDHVFADHERTGPTRDPGLHHLERPTGCWMRKLAQVLW